MRKSRLHLFGVVAGTVAMLANPAFGCGFQFAFERPDEQGAARVSVFRGDPVASLGGVRPLLFITSLKVNTDGTRISYNENDPTGRKCATEPDAANCAINNIRNAYNNHTRPVSDFEAIRDSGYSDLARVWQVLSADIIEKDKATGKPCITADGYLVSMTADVAVTGGGAMTGDCDQSKWIDALTMPAIVLPRATSSLPSQFATAGMKKRSAVIAVSRGSHRVVPGIVGDIGPARELGEANIAMNAALNGLAEGRVPKHRQDAIANFQAGATAIVLFPGSDYVVPRPISGASITAFSGELLEKFGGTDKLIACIVDEVDAGF